jgi:hypothetical protein
VNSPTAASASASLKAIWISAMAPAGSSGMDGTAKSGMGIQNSRATVPHSLKSCGA